MASLFPIRVLYVSLSSVFHPTVRTSASSVNERIGRVLSIPNPSLKCRHSVSRGQQAAEAALAGTQQTDFQMLWECTRRVTDAGNMYVIVANLRLPLCTHDLRYPCVGGCHGNNSSPSGPIRHDGPRHLSHQLGG